MKLFVNCSTISVGGAVQVATTFIENYFLCESKLEFYFVISKAINKQLLDLNINIESKKNFTIIKCSPAKIIRGIKSRLIIKKLVNNYKPDIIYSMGSPSYINFKNILEISRFTDPWVTHPNKYAYKTLTITGLMLTRMAVLYKIFSIRKLKYFVTQTNEAKQGLIKINRLSFSDVLVVPNCTNNIFFNSDNSKEKIIDSDTLRILVISAPYPHKNLKILPMISLKLNNKNIKHIFTTTIPEKSKLANELHKEFNSHNLHNNYRNLGPITLNECYRNYVNTDIVFLPTLLETFSVTILEAINMRKPLVTTDFQFNKNLSHNCALYYRPNDIEDASEKIAKLHHNRKLYDTIIHNMNSVSKQQISSQESFKIQVEWIKNIYLKEKSN